MTFRHEAVSFGGDDWSRQVADAGAVARVKQACAQQLQEGDMDKG